MEEMNTIEMQARESAAGTAGYAESTAPAGPEAPQGDLGGADNEGTGARRQTPEENARFAAMRRRQEAQQREERLFHELVGDARNPETGMPFASKAEFVAWRDGAAGRGRAQAAPVEPETLARLEAQLRQQFRATDPEFLAQAAELKKAHDREAQAQFSNDLKTIRAAYPDEKAQKVEELGIEFLKLCAGGISPLVAYEAIRNEKARSAANPPSMGDVKTSPTTEKEFFTRAEVAAMDQATVSRYFDKIRKSQQYWK